MAALALVDLVESSELKPRSLCLREISHGAGSPYKKPLYGESKEFKGDIKLSSSYLEWYSNSEPSEGNHKHIEPNGTNFSSSFTA